MNGKALVLLLFGIAISGCTTTRELSDGPAEWEASLVHADRVVIHDAAGERAEIRFRYIADGTLHGTQPDAARSDYSIPIGDIRQLEIREVSASHTIENALIGTFTVVGWILYAGLSSGAAGM